MPCKVSLILSRDSLGASHLNLDQLLGAFKQTLPNGKGDGVGKFANTIA